MKKKKPIVSSPFLLCLAAAFGICTSLTVDGAESVVQEHVNTSKKMYVKQDAEAQKCRELVKKGNYKDAIKLMEEKVIGELELEAGNVDSWMARERLQEYRNELQRIKIEYGNIKLDEAKKALNKGEYQKAVDFANDAINVTELMRERATPVVELARGRMNARNRKDAVSTDKSDPGLPARRAKAKQLLASAWNLYRVNKFDQAMALVEDVFILNPFDADAAYLASQIYKKFYQTGHQRRVADMRSQMAYEAWQWVEPVFPVSTDEQGDVKEEAIVKTDNDYGIQKKLDSIIFPTVSFNKTDLEAVVQFMRDNKIFDPDKEGVSISFIQPQVKEKKKDKDNAGNDPAMPEGGDGMGNDGMGNDEFDNADEGEEKASEDEGIYVTLNLKNVSLRDLLEFICYLTDLSYVVREDHVIFGAPDREMYSADYEIFDAVKIMVTGYDQGGSLENVELPTAEEETLTPAPAEGEDAVEGGDDAEDPMAEAEEPAPAAAAAQPAVDDKGITPASLQKFFELYGIEFPKGSSIGYFRGQVEMRNTAENHRRMKAILTELNVEKPLIEIEVKSIELAENDMEELGFNWSLGDFGNTSSGKAWKVSKGSNSKDGGMVKMLDAMLSGVDSRLVSGLNLFPDIFGSWTPFGIDESFNLSLTINALDRSDRTEQISAPRVLTTNGRPATVKMTKAYFFPEEWEEMEVETEELGDQGNVLVNITAPSPTFAETETDIGTIFTVTPTILQDGKTIRLKLNPRIAAYTGKDSYDVVVNISTLEDGKWIDNPERFVVWRPVIATREVDVQVDVNHGETLVIGGLSDSTSQSRIDKIPILADIPFVGRLFQNHSEVSTRRNMLIFVTAKLVNNAGVPLPLSSEVGNGGIPMLMR